MLKRWMIWMSFPVMAMACADAADVGETDENDPHDATFLVDGRADTDATYRRRVTDDCPRLEYVDPTNPNSGNQYTQTQYVYYQRN